MPLCGIVNSLYIEIHCSTDILWILRRIILNDILELLLDALIDSLKTLPFLFLTYLFIEYFEHRGSERLVHTLSKLGKFGIAGGAALGLVPQCGFSVAASNLYSGGIITAGTLAAVFVSTSDEAIPILLASDSSKSYLLWLLLIKFIIALIAGLVADFWIFKKANASNDPEAAHELLHSHCEHGCSHHGGIFKSALSHTLSVYLFILVIMAGFNILIYFIGEQAIASLFIKLPLLAPVVAALIGFIPNCASSVVLTELFVAGALPFGALVAGLITNTGIALMIMFKSEKLEKKMPFQMAAFLFVFAIIGGFATGLFIS